MPPQKPFIFLFTGDEFLRRSKIDSLLNQLLDPASRPTNLFRFHADDVDWDDLFTQAKTPSLLGGAQVFLISSSEKIKKTDLKSFEIYASHPVSGNYFIFDAEELSDSHPLVKFAAPYGKHTHFGREGKEESFNAFRAKLKRAAKTLTPDAWQMLEERLGSSPVLMNIAIDQLILYSDAPQIDEDQVQALSNQFLRYEPFDLTEALAAKDIERALKIFHFFYEMTEDMTSMVGLIHWQLKRIWQAKRLLIKGVRPEEIGRTLRIPPFRLSAFLNQAKRFDLNQLEKLLDALWQIDWNSKRGIGEEAIAMETFLIGASA